MTRKYRNRRSAARRDRFHADKLLNESAAGVAISGDSGSGKSNLMLLLMQRIAQQGIGFTLIDPHGDLAAEVERYCASLPARDQRRVLVVRYADTSHIVGMNPLAVANDPCDALTYAARVTSKVGHVAKILLYAWGEDSFNSRPVMFKWTTRFLTMLARAGLTISDVRHFFDVTSPIYQSLVQIAPDMVARLEMEELAEMRPREREELIASTKNRFLGFLENPITAMVLGKPDEWVDVARLIREGAIIIVNLERGGVLRDEDVEIFANLWLNEVLYAAYNTPKYERVPHMVFLDELPVFQSSYELITRALAQVRKFRIRIVSAFQGSQFFAERTEDRLLNALVGQCGVQFYFRHKNPVDAKFFGEIVKLPSINLLRKKHVLTQLQQYQDGHDIVTLTDESTNWSAAEQQGHSQTDAESNSTTRSSGRSSTTGESETRSQSERRIAESVSRAKSDSQSQTSSDSAGRSESHSDGQSWSNTQSHGGGKTLKQTLVPRIKTREVVTSIQFYAPGEEVTEEASHLTKLPTGTAILYDAHGASSVQLPLANDPLIRTPKFAARKLAELRKFVLSRSEFNTPAQLIAKREQFERKLLEYLNEQATASGSDRIDYVPPPDENPFLSI